MRNELANKLIQKYYDMFHEDSRGEQKPTMHRNIIYCSDGWYDILERLCEDVYAMRPKVMQIKEKFGTLRFYASFPSDYAEQGWERIRQAEQESAEICEICGEPGELRIIDGWRDTLCDKCHKRQLEKNKKSHGPVD